MSLTKEAQRPGYNTSFFVYGGDLIFGLHELLEHVLALPVVADSQPGQSATTNYASKFAWLLHLEGLVMRKQGRSSTATQDLCRGSDEADNEVFIR